jgi:hypothetical protein
LGFQPVSRDQSIYRQATFANIVITVYSAILREINTRGDKTRFRKVERGKFEAVAQ